MDNESPPNYEPSADDLERIDRLFRDIGSDNILSNEENLDIQHERQGMEREFLAEMRREMLDRLFGVSDLLETTLGFPERKAARLALKATCRLLTSYYDTSPEFRAKAAREALESALSALSEFDLKAGNDDAK